MLHIAYKSCRTDDVALRAPEGGPRYRSIVLDSPLQAASFQIVTDPQQRPRRHRKDMQWRE